MKLDSWMKATDVECSKTTITLYGCAGPGISWFARRKYLFTIGVGPPSGNSSKPNTTVSLKPTAAALKKSGENPGNGRRSTYPCSPSRAARLARKNLSQAHPQPLLHEPSIAFNHYPVPE